MSQKKRLSLNHGPKLAFSSIMSGIGKAVMKKSLQIGVSPTMKIRLLNYSYGGKLVFQELLHVIRSLFLKMFSRDS